MVVPYPAGGSTDVLFRIIAERFKEKLGQSFVVENKPGASGNIGIDHGRQRPAGWLHDRRRHRRTFFDQPIPDREDAVRCREGPCRTVAGLRAAERRGGRGTARAGQDAPGIHRLGQGAAERHLDRQPGSRHHAASFRRAVRGAHRRQCRTCAVPRRGADHSGDAVGRRHLRGRQSRVLHLADRIGRDARARRHLGAALADLAERADHGGGRREGLRRDLVGRLCDGRPPRRRRSSTSCPRCTRRSPPTKRCRSVSSPRAGGSCTARRRRPKRSPRRKPRCGRRSCGSRD